MTKLWSGRVTGDTDKLAEEFNSSLSFDKKLYPFDILQSIAHCKMLSECKIIEKADADKIIQGLNSIKTDIDNNKLKIENAEDIHMFIEAELIKRIGESGKKLHTARSRNDQVATVFRLYILDSIKNINGLLKNLINKLIEIAKNNLDTIMCGYTHLQKAQPVLLSHHLTAYCNMFYRDILRLNDCYSRTNEMPLGACALAGTTYKIDQTITQKELGFLAVCQNSMDAVSDRDFAAEFLFCCSLISTHLSRFCEEIILWSTDEFKYIKISDKFATGSSIMPNKKNPDIAELIRGKTGRVYGNLFNILTVLKGLPLSYNKDMQEDKEAVFDSETTIINCLTVFIKMLDGITFDKEKLKASANFGYVNATDIADYLVKRNIPFRTAHEITGKLVLYAEQKGKKLLDLSLLEFKKFSEIFDNDIYAAIDIVNVIKGRSNLSGTAKSSVNKSIEHLEQKLKSL